MSQLDKTSYEVFYNSMKLLPCDPNSYCPMDLNNKRFLTLVSLFIDWQYTTDSGQYSRWRTLTLIYFHTEGMLEVLSNSRFRDIYNSLAAFGNEPSVTQLPRQSVVRTFRDMHGIPGMIQRGLVGIVISPKCLLIFEF